MPATDKLSTSALARSLDVPIQQLFAALKDYEWIVRSGDDWLLTPKGEFEGGAYRDSKKYGRYIVGPADVAQHPLLVAIEAQQRHTAVEWSQREGLPHRDYIERLLVELSWLKDTSLGTVITPLGRAQGGELLATNPNRPAVTVWPSSAEHNAQLQAMIHHVKALLAIDSAPKSELFEILAPGQWSTIEGRQCGNPLQARCCNWLYLRRVSFATDCQLAPGAFADVYLPKERAVILLQPESARAGELKRFIETQGVFQSTGYPLAIFTAEQSGRLEYELDAWLKTLWSGLDTARI